LAKHNLSNTDLDMTGLGAVLTKRHLNSICPISKLPPELLSSVFSINVLCDRPGTKDGTYSLGWISVTQVCHQWREVRGTAQVGLVAFASGLTGWFIRSRSQRSLSGGFWILHTCRESGVQKCCVDRETVCLRLL
jgi:hypothetical protein